MSLAFTGSSTNKVTVANPQTFGPGIAFTWFMWLQLTSSLANSAGTSKAGTQQNDLFVYSNAGPDMFASINRATTTASAQTLTVPALNAWEFWAGTYDETDGPRLFRGTAASQIAEVAYSSRTVGSGSTSADNGDNLYINNRGASNSLALPLNIQTFAWFTRRMSLAELAVQQFAPMPDWGCSFFSHLGLFGASALDWSGNGNTGQITGATMGPPLGMRTPREGERRIQPTQSVMI